MTKMTPAEHSRLLNLQTELLRTIKERNEATAETGNLKTEISQTKAELVLVKAELNTLTQPQESVK